MKDRANVAAVAAKTSLRIWLWYRQPVAGRRVRWVAIVREIEPWDEILQQGREDERLVRQAMQHSRFPQLVELPEELHPDVAAALRARGVDGLYSHQAEAFEAWVEKTTIVTTGTASGKSLCFQLPTLDVLSR